MKPHISHNSGENEWYTPVEIIQAARETMGSICLDPASSDTAQESVQADKHFTKENDGLYQTWGGRVWLNPPFAQPLIANFVQKLLTEMPNINAACVLVNNATETRWLQNMLYECQAVCFVSGRIKFLDPEGITGQPLQGQVVVYFGSEAERFNATFAKFGRVMFT